MKSAYEEENLPLPLVRRSVPSAANEAEDISAVRFREDRLRPGTAGAFAGFVSGAAGLGVVHAMHLSRMGEGMLHMAGRLGVPADAAVPLSYLAAAVGGALVGAGFASVTQHLRRFLPLLIWAVVFFVSLTMLVLAISSTYGRGLGVPMAPAILLASVVFAFLASFQLPLRRRS